LHLDWLPFDGGAPLFTAEYRRPITGNRPLPGARAEASGGNRTHNPRITNAVLCQLKLRWRSDTRGESAATGLRRVAQSRWASQGAGFRNISATGGSVEQKKVGSRPGRSVLPWSSGSGARRPLDRKKSKTPLFHGVGDKDRKSLSGKLRTHSPCQNARPQKKKPTN
jgi:hypothetical protein